VTSTAGGGIRVFDRPVRAHLNGRIQHLCADIDYICQRSIWLFS